MTWGTGTWLIAGSQGNVYNASSHNTLVFLGCLGTARKILNSYTEHWTKCTLALEAILLFYIVVFVLFYFILLNMSNTEYWTHKKKTVFLQKKGTLAIERYYENFF